MLWGVSHHIVDILKLLHLNNENFTCCLAVCPQGRFCLDHHSLNCDAECHCKNNTICDYETGLCPYGCEQGWYGHSCDSKILKYNAICCSCWCCESKILKNNAMLFLLCCESKILNNNAMLFLWVL